MIFNKILTVEFRTVFIQKNTDKLHTFFFGTISSVFARYKYADFWVLN